MHKRLLTVLFTALALNFIWEELHSVLYISYQGGPVTNLILLRAALFDAAAITLFWFLLSPDPRGRVREWVFVVALVVFAISLEEWALGTGRWVYAEAMPIIPLLNVGLTPAIQLGFAGYVAVRVVDYMENKKQHPRECRYP